MAAVHSESSCYERPYSHTYGTRSRASSGTSATDGRFQALQLADLAPSSSGFPKTAPSHHSNEPRSLLHTRPYLSPLLYQTSTFLSTVAHTPTWNKDTLLVNIQSVAGSESPSQNSPMPTIKTENMSAVALPFDPSAFNIGSRSCFNWPVVETSNNHFSQDHFTSHHHHYHHHPPHSHPHSHYGSESSLTPPPSGSRSVTGSPPRGNLSLTPEQRELKRHRDHHRRDSKLHMRNRRTESGSSLYSPTSSVSDLATSATSMPVYTTAPTAMSLLAEPSAGQFLPSFSPPPVEHHQASMFPSPYPPSAYLSPDYPSYPTSSAPSLSSHYGRAILSDANMPMYQVSHSLTGPSSGPGPVRVVQARPKPQCWEHGCNGRQFSTFSNLLRHQREKSGQATKATCPNCGAEFTRTTARNGHLMHDKCKQKRNNSS